jgi:hypothetical protein
MISASVQFGLVKGDWGAWVGHKVRSGVAGLVCACVFVWPLLGLDRASGQDLPPVLVPTAQIKYLTGVKLERRNLKPLSVWLRDSPIRRLLAGFSANEEIAVVIDRRVDPGQLLNVGVENRSVEQFLWKVADAAGLGVCRFEDCYYFGPVETAAMLPILEADLKKVAKKKGRRSSIGWTSRRPLQTGVIVEPKAILEELGRTNGFEIKGLEQLPYDLWAGFSLPPSTLYARVQIVLSSFNKTFEISSNGKSITIIDFPVMQTATREFPVAKRLSDAADVKRQFPGLKLTFRGKSVVAKGAPLELSKLKRELVRRVKVEAGDEIVFTLKNEASRLTILRTIAANGGFELVLESGDPSELSSIIQIDVVKVSRGELIFKTLEGTGLRGKIEDGKLVIGRD